MAIAFDAALGANDVTAVSSINLTTTAAVAANARVVVFVSWFSSLGRTVTGVTIGGTAATQDKHATNGSDFYDIWSAHIPGGLASGSTITATFSGSVAGGMLIGAGSFTGVASSGALVTTGAVNGSAAGWSSGAATNTGFADAVYAGGSGAENAVSATSTPVSGSEINDRYDTTDQQGIVSGYKIVSTVASDSVTGTFTNASSTANTGALAIYAAAGGTAAPTPQIDLGSPAFLNGPDAPPGFFESLLLPVPSADVITPIADADSGTGSETSDVQATVPGSDSSTGSEAGTVSATVSDSDSGTGTDTQTSLVIPIASTDSGTGTEAGTASVTAPGSDTSSGSESGTVSATASGSESATGSDSGTAAVTTSSSDTASGTDTGSASVSAPGSDSGTGTDGGVVTETGAGGEGGAGFDTGTVSVTASGTDSGTGSETGTVVDTTGGPDLISGSDSGAGTELGTVLDLTPPAPPVVDTGPSGGTRVVDSDYGDETAIFPVEETRRVTGLDFGIGIEAGVVVDLTPRKPLRIRLPRRAAPAPVVEPEPVETFRAVFDGDAGLATDTQALGVEVGGADVARGSETDDLQDMSEGDAEELQILTLLGLL
jgi:hypothetical protein